MAQRIRDERPRDADQQKRGESDGRSEDGGRELQVRQRDEQEEREHEGGHGGQGRAADERASAPACADFADDRAESFLRRHVGSGRVP